MSCFPRSKVIPSFQLSTKEKGKAFFLFCHRQPPEPTPLSSGPLVVSDLKTNSSTTLLLEAGIAGIEELVEMKPSSPDLAYSKGTTTTHTSPQLLTSSKLDSSTGQPNPAPTVVESDSLEVDLKLSWRLTPWGRFVEDSLGFGLVGFAGLLYLEPTVCRPLSPDGLGWIGSGLVAELWKPPWIDTRLLVFCFELWTRYQVTSRNLHRPSAVLYPYEAHFQAPSDLSLCPPTDDPDLDRSFVALDAWGFYHLMVMDWYQRRVGDWYLVTLNRFSKFYFYP